MYQKIFENKKFGALNALKKVDLSSNYIFFQINDNKNQGVFNKAIIFYN